MLRLLCVKSEFSEFRIKTGYQEAKPRDHSTRVSLSHASFFYKRFSPTENLSFDAGITCSVQNALLLHLAPHRHWLLCETSPLLFISSIDVASFSVACWMIEQLFDLTWNSLLSTIYNGMTNRFVVHNDPMLYPGSYLPLFAPQHLPSRGDKILWTLPHLTSKICDKWTKLIEFNNFSIYNFNKHTVR